MKTKKMFVAMFLVLALAMGSALGEVVLLEDFDYGEGEWLITEGSPGFTGDAGHGWVHYHYGGIGSERDLQVTSKLDGKPGSGYEGVLDPTDQQADFTTAVNPAVRPGKEFSRTATSSEDLIFTATAMVEYGQSNTYYGVAAAQVAESYPYQRGPFIIQEGRDWDFYVPEFLALSGNQEHLPDLFGATTWEGHLVHMEIHMSAASNEVWVVMNSPYGGLSTTSSRITLIDDAQTLMTRGWMMATTASMGWVDDIKVELVPEPVTLASLALGGVLLLLRRRR